MMDRRNRRAGSEYGATAIEYGLIAALVAVVIIGALVALGASLENKFASTASTVEPAAPGSSADESTITPSASATSTKTPEPGGETSAGAPAVESATPTAGGERPRVGSDTLCWLGPGPGYAVASAVEAGIPIEVLGLDLGGDWLVVNNPHFPGVVCWIPIAAVEIPDSAVLPDRIFSAPPTPTHTPEPERERGCIVNITCEVPCPVPNPEQYPACYR